MEEHHKLKKLLIDYRTKSEKTLTSFSVEGIITLSEINEKIEDIAGGKVDPKQDWDCELIPKAKESLKYDQIEHFRQAVIRQIAFIHFITDIKLDMAESNDTGIRFTNKIVSYIIEAQLAIQWAYTYWSAYNISNIVVNRKLENIPSKGGKERARQVKEEAILLLSLARTNLKKERPPKGWVSVYKAAEVISEALIPIIIDNKFPLSTDSAILYDKILKLIESDKSVLRKTFDENAKLKY